MYACMCYSERSPAFLRGVRVSRSFSKKFFITSMDRIVNKRFRALNVNRYDTQANSDLFHNFSRNTPLDAVSTR
jgi:hypothetical protein